MEKTGKEPSAAEVAVHLSPQKNVREQLDSLDALPSERNRFFPGILNVAGQEISGIKLTGLLLDLVDSFAKSAAEPRRTQVVKRMLNQLPHYLKVLMPDGEELDATIDLYLEILREKENHKESVVRQHSGVEESNFNARKGAPRGIKKIMDIPEEERSSAQRHQLHKYLHKLGGRGLGVTQPSQRELARLQAEQNRRQN